MTETFTPKKVALIGAGAVLLAGFIINSPAVLGTVKAVENEQAVVGSLIETQTITLTHPVDPPVLVRDNYTSERAPQPDPAGAKLIAHRVMFSKYSWATENQYDCLVSLWQKESNWRHTAENKQSGAYGIPQSLPGNKMATIAGDWRTNPETQILWGLKYIDGRYGTACNAWEHSKQKNWY